MGIVDIRVGLAEVSLDQKNGMDELDAVYDKTKMVLGLGSECTSVPVLFEGWEEESVLEVFLVDPEY